MKGLLIARRESLVTWALISLAVSRRRWSGLGGSTAVPVSGRFGVGALGFRRVV